MITRRFFASTLATCALFGCGEETVVEMDPPPASACAPDDFVAPIAPDLPELPSAVLAPRVSSCPSGWRVIEGDGVEPATCDPWPEGGRRACSPGDAHFPGESGCRPIGADCPCEPGSSDCPDIVWPSEQPLSGTIIYVSPAAAPGGNGSNQRPFISLEDAVAGTADEDAAFVLSNGVFPVRDLVMTGRRSLWGTCAAQTILRAIEPTTRRPTVWVDGSGVEVRNLQITGPRLGMIVLPDAGVKLEGVWIVEAAGVGLLIDRALPSQATDLVISRTRGSGILVQFGGMFEVTRGVFEENEQAGVLLSGRSDPLAAWLSDVAFIANRGEDLNQVRGGALCVFDGSFATVRRSVFEDNATRSIVADGAGTELTLHDLFVRDTAGHLGDMEGGNGLTAQSGARVHAERAVFRRNREASVIATSSGTITLADVLIADSLGRSLDARGGVGLQAQNGSTIRADRLAVHDSTGLGIAGFGSALELTDVGVFDTKSSAEVDPSRNLRGGRGLSVDGGELTLHAALFERNRDVAVVLDDTRGELEDVTIRDTFSEEATGTGGSGLAIQWSEISGRRLLVEHNRGFGVTVLGDGAHAELSDLVVRNTQAMESDGCCGSGLQILRQASASLTRALFEGNRTNGLAAYDFDTTLELHHLIVRDTQSRKQDGRFGRGLELGEGAVITGSNILLEDNRDAGLAAFGPDTKISLQEVQVLRTQERACVSDGCPARGAGRGVLSGENAEISLDKFLISQNVLCGVQLVREGRIELMRGLLSEHPVGVNIASGVPVDVDALQNEVSYLCNEVPFDSSVLPPPDQLGDLVPER